MQLSHFFSGVTSLVNSAFHYASILTVAVVCLAMIEWSKSMLPIELDGGLIRAAHFKEHRSNSLGVGFLEQEIHQTSANTAPAKILSHSKIQKVNLI
jgi:hypothetical protein